MATPSSPALVAPGLISLSAFDLYGGASSLWFRKPVRSVRPPALKVHDLTERTIEACSLCGSQVEQDADGPCCEGAEIVETKVWRAEAA